VGEILDSSVLIAAERGRFDLQRYFSSRAGEEFFISAVTWSELLHGLERAREARIKERRRRWIEENVANLGMLSFGRSEAEQHARIWADVESRGMMIGPHDLLIAATALSSNYSLATLNEKEFVRVTGLKLADVARFKRS